MANQITCPHCKQDFTIEDIVESSIKEGFNKKYLEHKKQLDEKTAAKQLELETREKQFQKQMEDAQRNQQKVLKDKEEQIRLALSKELQADVDAKLKHLEFDLAEKSAKLKTANEQELELRKQQRTLLEKQENMELEIQRKMDTQRKEIEEKIRKSEQEQQFMKIQEKDQLINEMRRQMEDMKRKVEQGSMQSQGEIQELELEKMLQAAFPFDVIEPVAKGVQGADCVQMVRNSLGKNCGNIIYESKRTKAYSPQWLEKLKADSRAAKADVAVLVTETLPKDLEQFGCVDGIWICNFHQVKALTAALRDGILKLDEVKSAQENKGDKINMLYSYLTGNEFTQKVKAIYEAFDSMNSSLENEKKQMLKIWASRQKQIEQVMINTVEMYGSIKGIAGSSILSIPELELGGHLTDEGKLL